MHYESDVTMNYSLDSKSDLTRYTAPHLTPLTLLATLASSLTNILPFLTKFQPSPKRAITILDGKCYFPSVRTEIKCKISLFSIKLRNLAVNFHPYGRKIANYYT